MTRPSVFVSLGTSLLALSSLTQARPARFRPSWLSARTGPSVTTAGSSCSTSADCGPDAPSCDFPWIFSVAPFNLMGKQCMLADAFGFCKTNAQCTTGTCVGGLCLPAYSTCVGNNCTRTPTTSMPCVYDIDCDGRGRCGTDTDVRANGTSLAGKCLVAGGGTCTENAECQSGACSTNGKCANDGFGLPAPNQNTCASGFKQGHRKYTPAVQSSTGSWSMSAHSYYINYCLWSDVGTTCSASTDCQSGNCLNATGSGMQCGAGAAVGAPCAHDVDCHTGRCAATPSSSSSVCTYQPPGAPCSMMSQCTSGLCSNGVCQGAIGGATCDFASDCQSGVCDANNVCGVVSTTSTATISTTTSTTSTSTTSTSSSSSTASTTSISSSSSTTSTTSSTSPSTSSASTSTSTTSTSTSSIKFTSTTTRPPATSTTTSTKSITTTTTTATTAKPLPSGAVCTTNTACQSKYCRAKLLSNGTRATTGTCDVPKPSGSACYQSNGCTSLKCSIAKGATSGTCR